MPEALEADKFGAIFDISKLFVGSPPDEMVVFEDERSGTLTLLNRYKNTSCKNSPALYLFLMLALSLKSG